MAFGRAAKGSGAFRFGVDTRRLPCRFPRRFVLRPLHSRAAWLSGRAAKGSGASRFGVDTRRLPCRFAATPLHYIEFAVASGKQLSSDKTGIRVVVRREDALFTGSC